MCLHSLFHCPLLKISTSPSSTCALMHCQCYCVHFSTYLPPCPFICLHLSMPIFHDKGENVLLSVLAVCSSEVSVWGDFCSTPKRYYSHYWLLSCPSLLKFWLISLYFIFLRYLIFLVVHVTPVMCLVFLFIYLFIFVLSSDFFAFSNTELALIIYSKIYSYLFMSKISLYMRFFGRYNSGLH